MPRRNPALAWLAVGAVAVFLAGCTGQPAGLTQVRGKVFYKGAPVKGGVIVFTPDPNRGPRGDPASAVIQADGSYQLKTGDSHGAAPGWHRVTIAAIQPATVAIKNHPYAPLPKSLLPDKYRDPDLSGLSCEIKANQVNTIDIQLD